MIAGNLTESELQMRLDVAARLRQAAEELQRAKRDAIAILGPEDCRRLLRSFYRRPHRGDEFDMQPLVVNVNNAVSAL